MTQVAFVSLSLQKPGLDVRLNHAQILVTKWRREGVFSKVLQLSPVSIIPPTYHSFIQPSIGNDIKSQ